MEVSPVVSLKSKAPEASLEQCFICQSKKKDPLRSGSDEGKKRLREVAVLRRKFHDTDNSDIIDRIESLQSTEWTDLKVLWHKSCYSTFTSNDKINRLKEKLKALEPNVSEENPPSPTTTRTKLQGMDWSCCMFCQSNNKEGMHQVECIPTSNNIQSLAEGHPVMRIRLAGVGDLIAAEGKYHLKCLSKFRRECRTPAEDTGIDNVIAELTHHLEDGLSQGHVYDMGDIWNIYVNRKQEMGHEIPRRYVSRKQSFYEDVKQVLGAQAQFVRPLGKHASILVYPGSEANYVIAKSLTKATQGFHFESYASESESDSETSSQTSFILEPCGTTILQELVHVALKVRSDLSDMPGHDTLWEGIDTEHVVKIIPESLFLLLRIMFGGINVLEGDDDYKDEAVEMKCCSIAQDIIYGVSNGAKLTPKHVGLGLALHQATRSETLVNLFNSANHIIGINTIRRIDNSIANNVLERYIENGCVYIPYNIERGTFTHYSCDNIDVIESTLDGRNTFHSTQMVAWQRKTQDEQAVVVEERPTFKLDRSVSKDAMQTLHELDKATLPKGMRPQPNMEINESEVETWFKDYDSERTEAHVRDIGWLTARQYEPNEQKVPAWRAYNESSSTVNPPMTKVGLLPILQAPADEYDTITTVINRFKAISQHLGQTHTVITSDQPLYAKGKELVWANKDLFNNVIFRLGGLHVCFNYLKAIGQRFESAGLEDLWIEAGLYPPNVTENMLSGKAYYRAVRAHTLTYEALWRLRWVMFRSWLTIKSVDSADIEKIDEACESVVSAFSEKKDGYSENVMERVADLNKVVKETGLLLQLKEFDDACRNNSNYVFWMTYMAWCLHC